MPAVHGVDQCALVQIWLAFPRELNSSRMEGPCLDMMETERHARLDKRERLLDITGFILIWRWRVLVAFGIFG
jgi:hypothetical protein